MRVVFVVSQQRIVVLCIIMSFTIQLIPDWLHDKKLRKGVGLSEESKELKVEVRSPH